VIVARGASDDKGQLMTFVEACPRLHRRSPWRSALSTSPSCSRARRNPARPRFTPSSKANKDELSCDLALVCDTGMWDPSTPAISVMLRGMVGDEIIVKAASRDLHSGMYRRLGAEPEPHRGGHYRRPA
jgi:acetylornithine deacetylase/succinyl-diaminopimelate desuccinylase-like protein